MLAREGPNVDEDAHQMTREAQRDDAAMLFQRCLDMLDLRFIAVDLEK